MYQEFGDREDRELRVRIAKAITASAERYPLRTRRGPDAPKGVQREIAPQRGVYEAEFSPVGRRAFNLVASNGDVGYVDFPAHWASRDLIRNLWRRLDREDPPGPLLHIVKPGPSFGP